MNEIKIEKVVCESDLKEFIKVTYKVYERDPYWVPQLISDQKEIFSQKNPFFEHGEVAFFVAKKDDIPVGRIAAILNHRHIEFNGEKAGFFGFFEAIHDSTVASALLDNVKAWLKERGMEIMRGPMNFSTNEECGFLIEGFDSSPFLMMPYNPPYYLKLIEDYGFIKAKDLFAYIINVPENIEPRVLRVADMARTQGVTVRKMDMNRFDAEIEAFKQVYNTAWEKNWGFIPMTEREIEWMAKRLKQIIIPELALIAEIDGKPAGFFLALPDYNQALKRLNGRLFPTGILKLLWYSRKITDIRVVIMGILKEHRKKGIDAIIYHESWKAARKRGYKRTEFSWVLEDNVPVHKTVELLGASLYKKYRIYEIKI